MYKGRGCGDLAANIGTTNEKPFTNTISNQSFNCSKESVFRQFKTSHASHRLGGSEQSHVAGRTMRNARLEEAQARIKIARRNINNLRYADDTTLMAESEE